MQIFLNGQFVAENRAVVSVFDRGFLYGDGLFETTRVVNGRPFRWAQHLARLQRGADFLKIKLPFTPTELRDFADQLIHQNRLPDSLLRLTVSRGVGARGYSPKGADRPTVVMSLHPAPGLEPAPGWKLITASLRLPAGDPLAQFKTCNKLWQVLARAEADAAQADEALLLNINGQVAEATSANVFWVEGGAVQTPALDGGILPGVTRAAVLEICRQAGLPVAEEGTTPCRLRHADGIFLALSSWGIVEVASLDGVEQKKSPLTGHLRKAYQELLLSSS